MLRMKGATRIELLKNTNQELYILHIPFENKVSW